MNKNIWLWVILVAVVAVLAVVLFGGSANYTAQIPEDSTSAINQELADIDLDDLDADFNSINSDLGNL